MKRSKMITIAPKMQAKLTIQFFSNVEAYECLFELQRWSKFLGILGPERLRKVELGGIVKDETKVKPFVDSICKYMHERFQDIDTEQLNSELTNFFKAHIHGNKKRKNQN